MLVNGFHEPLALCMKVYAAHGSLDLVETDIVEPFKAGARDCADSVVGDQEIFLPPHEYMLALSKVAVGEVGSFGLLGQWSPCGKPRPVVHVCFLRSAPFLIASLKRMLSADNFAFEKCGQGGMVFRESWDNRKLASIQDSKADRCALVSPTLYAQIAAHIGLGHINVFNLDVHIVNLAIRLLRADEFTS